MTKASGKANPTSVTRRRFLQASSGLAVSAALGAPFVRPASAAPLRVEKDELKSSIVEVAPFDAAWFGFAVLRERPCDIAADYWAVARTEGGWRIELAGRTAPDDWRAFARRLFGLDASAEESVLMFSDQRSGHARFASFDGPRLRAALYVGRNPVPVSRAWLAGHLAHHRIEDAERSVLLAGRAGGQRPDPGPTICSCFNVGANQIAGAIAEGGCTSIEEIGAALGAGTNCGSCRSEIQRILGNVVIREAI